MCVDHQRFPISLPSLSYASNHTKAIVPRHGRRFASLGGRPKRFRTPATMGEAATGLKLSDEMCVDQAFGAVPFRPFCSWLCMSYFAFDRNCVEKGLHQQVRKQWETNGKQSPNIKSSVM